MIHRFHLRQCAWFACLALFLFVRTAGAESEQPFGNDTLNNMQESKGKTSGDGATGAGGTSEEAKKMTDAHRYVVRRVREQPALNGAWDSPAWQHAQVADVAHFHPKSSDHRPTTQVKLLYDHNGVYVFFRVADRYVLSTRTAYQEAVYRDACVEFFVQPKPGGHSGENGYLNFEMNSGGTLLLHYNKPSREEGQAATTEDVPWSLASQVRVYHSLPKAVTQEITEPVTWCLEYFVPFSLLEQYVGPLGNVAGQEWRANFYKCAEDNSHPHWAAWNPIGEALNFHQPKYFGFVRFEE